LDRNMHDWQGCGFKSIVFVSQIEAIVSFRQKLKPARDTSPNQLLLLYNLRPRCTLERLGRQFEGCFGRYNVTRASEILPGRDVHDKCTLVGSSGGAWIDGWVGKIHV